ncbi:tyrosine-type recombinase/integrase [Actinocorallia sp. A-T 12471]|uniref:tyrosine-type recombinase/integrase n=1 Tax=Actinocorallia sp. A-T 12471 TaxID=3089813 RepID=UPI0039B6F570
MPLLRRRLPTRMAPPPVHHLHPSQPRPHRRHRVPHPRRLDRFWNHARTQASLPPTFTPYNARHTGISWAIAKGIDLQKVRQRAGHGSLEVTSRYAAILNEEDTTLADALEEIFDSFKP